MQKVIPPEGFAFNLDEGDGTILLRIEDHREDPLFQDRVVDESHAIRRGIRALGLDPALAEIDRSRSGAAEIEGEAGSYTMRHVTLRWSRRTVRVRPRGRPEIRTRHADLGAVPAKALTRQLSVPRAKSTT